MGMRDHMENNTTNTARTVWDPAEKKLFGRNVDFINWGVLLYYGVLLFVSIFCTVIYMAIGIAIAGIKGDLSSIDSIADHLLETDGGMIAAVICGSAVMILFMMKRVKVKEIFAKQKKMTFPAFISLLFVFMSFQLPTMIMYSAGEALLNLFGFSVETAMESASANSTTFSMMVYVGFFAPFFEEFIFRGFVMRAYSKTNCGKFLAIVMSASIFGIMHGNPVQIFYAAAVGVVLGYTAMEYGIIWSILLHFLNNFVFGDVTTFLFKMLPETAANILDIVIFAVFFLGGILVLILNSKKIVAYVRENVCDKRYILRSFLSVPLIIFAAICVLEAVMLIQKI